MRNATIVASSSYPTTQARCNLPTQTVDAPEPIGRSAGRHFHVPDGAEGRQRLAAKAVAPERAQVIVRGDLARPVFLAETSGPQGRIQGEHIKLAPYVLACSLPAKSSIVGSV